MRLARLAGIVTAGALLLSVAAPVSAADTTMIRVLHGSPDAPNVDVYADGGKIITNLAFGEISSYLEVPAKTYAVRVCATGSDGTVDANCPIIASLPFAAGMKYTVAASDLLAQIKADVFTDGPAVEGKASVRVIHLSADTPAVDVLTEDGATKVFNDVKYPKATDYAALAAGSYDLKVCLHSDNTTCPDAVNPGALDLAAHTAYSVYAVGSLTPSETVMGLKLVVAVDDVKTPSTDTEPAGTSPATLLLVVAGLAAVAVGTRRLVAVRASR